VRLPISLPESGPLPRAGSTRHRADCSRHSLCREGALGRALPAQAALPRVMAQTLGTAVPRAHLALVTGPSTTDGVNCEPHSCAESRGKSSRHRRALCREPVGGSRHRRGVRWPLTEVGSTPVPRAVDSALGTELTSEPAGGSFAESWANRLSAQSLSGPPVSPSMPRANGRDGRYVAS
jgi:hypothetical protein